MYAVVNNSVHVFVGEPVVVGEDIQVTVDCSPLINVVVNNGISNTIVTWYKDGAQLTNGSAVNVVISADNKLCIITDTLLTVGGQFGTDGNYTCEICNRSTCMQNATLLDVCGKYVSIKSVIIFIQYVYLYLHSCTKYNATSIFSSSISKVCNTNMWAGCYHS